MKPWKPTHSLTWGSRKRLIMVTGKLATDRKGRVYKKFTNTWFEVVRLQKPGMEAPTMALCVSQGYTLRTLVRK